MSNSTAGRRKRLSMPMGVSILLAAALLLVLLLVLLPAGFSIFGASPPRYTPYTKEILHMPLVAYGNDISTMDPARVQDYIAYEPVSLVFPGLLTLDAHGNVTPWAAASMPTFNPLDNTYTFKLRRGLAWSDGTPIDANTFAYSINRALSPCTASAVTYYLFPLKDAEAFSMESCDNAKQTIHGRIQTLIGDSITTPDPQMLVLALSAPAPYFLQALTFPTTYAQPQQLIAQYGTRDWTNHLAGFGGNLYNVRAWNHQGILALTPNLRFWGRKPELSEIVFTIYKTMPDEYGDYLNGKLDVGFPPPETYQDAKRRADFHQFPMLETTYFQLDWSKPPFDDLRARLAFALALDKVALANAVYHGAVFATNHIVQQGMYGYNPNLVGPDGTTNLTGNLALAQGLMASYAQDKCGGKLSKCPPTFILGDCFGGDPQVLATEQAAIQAWQQAFPGYPVKLENNDFCGPLIPVPFTANTPPIVDLTWVADYADPQDWLSLQFEPNAINNIGNVNVPAANTLMAQADADQNPTDRASLYNQAEQLLVMQCAWIPLFQQWFFYNQPSYVHGLAFTALGTIPLASWQQLAVYPH